MIKIRLVARPKNKLKSRRKALEMSARFYSVRRNRLVRINEDVL
jgi:hypothetical protein